MITNLSILSPLGDQELTWNPSNAEQVAAARAAVQNLKALGYSFFPADGTTPADEVTAGNGALSVRRVSAEELLPPELPLVCLDPPLRALPISEDRTPEQLAADGDAPREEQPKKGRRGRKPYRTGRLAVAVPPMAGG